MSATPDEEDVLYLALGPPWDDEEQEQFYSEDEARDEKGRWTLVGDASHLGGTTAKQIYQRDGQKYLFKPDPAMKILGAETASKIAQLINPGSIVAASQVVDGKTGLMQQLVEGAKPLGPLSALSKQDIGQLQREHVVDWITSQHDSHPGQFLRDASGKVLGTDKSQAWKYFPNDKLRTDYHPNAKYGEKPPIYNTLFGPGGIGRSKMDPEAIRTVMDRIKQITPEQTATMLNGYATSRFGHGTPAYRDFIKAAHERIASAPKAFSDYYSHVLKRQVKFGAGLSDEALRRAEFGDCSDLDVEQRFVEVQRFYSEDEPRNEKGEWTSGGGTFTEPPFGAAIDKMFREDRERGIKTTSVLLYEGKFDDHLEHVRAAMKAAGYKETNGMGLELPGVKEGAELQYVKNGQELNVYMRSNGQVTALTADETPMDAGGRLHTTDNFIPGHLRDVLAPRAKRYGAHKFEADFDESKHPRGPDGKFEDGGGMKDAPEPELVKTGEGNPTKSLEKQKQLETWKKYGKTYREKKARLKEEARLKALGLTPKTGTTSATKMETVTQFIAMANEWKKDAVGYGAGAAIDRAITAVQDTAHPTFAQNWIDLVNEHGGNAVAMGLSVSPYGSFKALSDNLASAKSASLDVLLQGPRPGQGIPDREALKIAAAIQLGFTVKEYTAGAQAVGSYVGAAYTKINGTLRESGHMTGTGKNLDRFLGKLPEVTGAKELYRAFTLGDTKGALATALKAGHGNFTDPAFVSATTSKTFAEHWKAGGVEGIRDSFFVTWKNEGGFKNATPWGGAGAGEGEVIGRPGSKIEILSSHYNGSSHKWEVSVRWLPNPAHGAESKVPSNYKPPPTAAPKTPAAGPTKTHYYEKKISPNTGKAYYVKKKIKP
jgi:hypothetical protein